MMKIKSAFKDRTIAFFLGLGGACATLIISLVYILLAGNDRTFSLAGFVFLVVGALSELVVVFTDVKFGPLLPVAITSIGTGLSVVTCLPTLMDLVNGINFFGGNLAIAFAVPIVTILSLILECITCFMNERKSVVVTVS